MERKNFLCATAGLAFMACAMPLFPAAAQPATGAPTVPAEGMRVGGIGDIVVTARRRAESLSRVPTSVAALDATSLQERMIATETDLQRSVPGLVVRESLSSQQLSFVIRGQTFDPFSSSPPAVQPYINDVPMSPVGANTFFDLGAIQVLKGPQGTLFGRNTTGGAILFDTARPTNEAGGYITGRIGNYDLREIEGALNAPIVPDKILVRIAGKYKRRDGFIRNHMLNQRLGDEDSISGRITLTLRPTETIETMTMFQYSEDHGSSSGGVLYGVNSCGAPGLTTGPDCTYGPANPAFATYLAANPGVFPDGLGAYLGLQKSLGLYDVYHNSPSYYDSRSKFLTNTTTIELGDDTTLKNVAGYYNGFLYESIDVDGSPYPIFNYGPVGASTGKEDGASQWSEELQLQGKLFDSKLDYIVGGFYSKASFKHYNPQTVFDLTPVFGPTVVTLDNKRKSTSKALFAQVTYDLGDATGMQGLSVTAGYRHTWEKVSLSQLPRSVFIGAPTLETTFSVPSWQAGVQYQASDSLLLYLVHRGSWRSGGFNAFGSPSPGEYALEDSGIQFKKETVKDIEFGAKFQGDIAGMAARLNLAAYYQVTKDVQRNLPVDLGGGPGSATVNVPQSKAKGFEIDSQIQPATWLSLGGNISYTDAWFSKPIALVLGNPTHFGPFPDSPKWSLSSFAEFTLPVGEGLGDVSLRGDVYHQTKSYFSSLHNSLIPGTELPGYTVANFRLSWTEIAASGFSAALFVNNAFDEKYLTGGLPLGALFGLNIASVGRPRTYGAEISFRF